MKVIKANDIKIEQIPNVSELFVTPQEAVKQLIKIENEHIQYAKAERDTDLINCSMHPFVEAVHLAYSYHVPLHISPDMIWYLISSGVAVHINQNAEELRKTFVNHEGKKEIEIRRDDFRLNSPNPWHEVIDDFSIKIGENTNNNVADLMMANFSTTTKDSRVISQIVLMDAMQKYFDYKFTTCCGIPEIRLTGTKQDWENVKSKSEGLLKLVPKMNVWIKSLEEILQHFINAFDDKIDKTFWNSIYKIGGGSGGPYITGWLIALFPYLDRGSKNQYVWAGTWRDASNGHCFSGLTTSCFDYHMNQVPFIWNYFEQEIKMLFVGGLIGIVYEKDNSLRPVFGYAVTEDKIKTKSNEMDF